MNNVLELQKQHYDNYVEAVKETVKANTLSLLENDINPLFKTPPLDSMDQIKSKFLLVAKKEKIILETDNLNKLLNNFRKNIEISLNKIVDIRNNDIIDSFKDLIKEEKILKVTKTQMNNSSKKIKKIIRDELDNCIKKYIIDKINTVFSKEEKGKDKSVNEIKKFLDSKGIYQKQVLESIDFKLLVKDTILINGVKEQTDRYNFTLNNSRIFNE